MASMSRLEALYKRALKSCFNYTNKKGKMSTAKKQCSISVFRYSFLHLHVPLYKVCVFTNDY